MNNKKTVNVSFFGFSDQDIAKFSKIFQISRPDKRSYQVKVFNRKNIDLVIVNTNSKAANQKLKLLRINNPTLPIITAGQNRSPHHLPSMLLPSRLFKLLDGIALTQERPEQNEPATQKTDKPQRDPNKKPEKPAIKKVAKAKPSASEQSPQEPVKQATKKPVKQTTQKSAEPTSQEPIEPTSTESAFQVLVVDDSELMQKALKIELDQAESKMDIDFADTGEEALQRVDEKRYDFIFLDIMMPGIDGFETCSTIRKKTAMKKTPIIMLSAKTSPLDEVKGVMAGCTTYLTKPIKHDDFQALMKRITTWLENFQKQSSNIA